jgi:phosphoesterase RecJ-like protein
MNQSPIDAVRAQIAPAQRILLVTHVGPDGDAIGSLLGLGLLLEAQGKAPTLACQDPVPDSAAFLPGSERIVQSVAGEYDLLISLDCSDPRRMGDVVTDDLSPLPLVNIDHHVTNTYFGAVNWVDPGSVATAQMVLALADAAGWAVTSSVATCLLNGILTDTRSFRTANVDDAAVAAALRLMQAGASLTTITRQALEQRSLASVQLWGEAITHVELDDGVLSAAITQEMCRRWGVSDKEFSGLANFLSGVREIDISMRSAPEIDVSTVALALGGGGHPQAAGATLHGGLVEVRARVLDRIRSSVAGQVRAAD